MNKTDLYKSIEELAKLDVELKKKGGPSKAGKLFETYLEKQRELLSELIK